MAIVHKKATKWPDLEVTVQWHLGSKKSHFLKNTDHHVNELHWNRFKHTQEMISEARKG